jgi:hypothetical protein
VGQRVIIPQPLKGGQAFASLAIRFDRRKDEFGACFIFAVIVSGSAAGFPDCRSRAQTLSERTAKFLGVEIRLDISKKYLPQDK